MSAFNSQGCAISDSMRLRSFKRYLSTLPTPKPFVSFEYRGFEIGGRGSKWYISGSDPRVFKSRAKVQEAVDVCLALRAELDK